MDHHFPPHFGKNSPLGEASALGVPETSTLKVDIQDMGGGLDVLDDLKCVRIPDVGM